MTTATDQQLLQLAADRPQPVLTILKRADAFRPLVFVLALIPGLLVIRGDELMRYDSLFILQCLDQWNGTVILPFSLPHWMTGVTLRLTELPLGWRLLLPTYFCGVVLVLVVFMLTQTMLNSRCGLLTALLLILHPWYLEQLTHQVTPMCGLALIMMALWGYQRHLLQNTIFSPYLLVGAVAGGLNMFVSPPYTYFLVIWLAAETILHGIVQHALPKSGPTRTPKEVGMGHSLRFRLISLAGMGTIVFASGLLLFSLRWLREDELQSLVPPLTAFSGQEQRLLAALLESTGFLSGFILIGLGVCGRAFIQRGRQATSLRFWFIGVVLSGLTWISADNSLSHLPALVAGWKLLFTIAILVCVAIALDKMMEREIPLFHAMIAFGFALSLGLWYILDQVEILTMWYRLGIVIVAATLCWYIWGRIQGYESRAGFLLRWGMVGLLVMCLGNGIESRDDNQFFSQNVNQFEQGIEKVVKEADRFIVISEQELQPTLLAILRLQWLDRSLERCRDWNEALNKLKTADQTEPPSVLIVNTESLVAPDLASTLPGWKLQPVDSEYYLRHYVLSVYFAQHD